MNESIATINLYTDNASRIKCMKNGEGDVSEWILRSPSLNSDKLFLMSSATGWVSPYCQPLVAYGVCFGFCI